MIRRSIDWGATMALSLVLGFTAIACDDEDETLAEEAGVHDMDPVSNSVDELEEESGIHSEDPPTSAEEMKREAGLEEENDPPPKSVEELKKEAGVESYEE